jgi:hypothetical protein
MQLIFFDEAKDDKEYPVYHIGGVCIDEVDLADVEARIAQLAEKSFGNSLLARDTEFHAAEIFHRKSHFKTWENFGARLGLLKEFISILSLEQVGLIDIQINSAKLHDSQSSSDIAFMFLCERSSQLMRARGAMGMLIGDRDTDSSAAKCADAAVARFGGADQLGRQGQGRIGVEAWALGSSLGLELGLGVRVGP